MTEVPLYGANDLSLGPAHTLPSWRCVHVGRVASNEDSLQQGERGPAAKMKRAIKIEKCSTLLHTAALGAPHGRPVPVGPRHRVPQTPGARCWGDQSPPPPLTTVVEREFFSDNLLARIHLIIEMILVDRPCAMGV